VGSLARFFKGALTIPVMMNMRWKNTGDPINDLLFWYENMIFQQTEEEVIYNLRYDKDGKERKLPPFFQIRKIVEAKIKENKEKHKAELIYYRGVVNG
jgi:hypothetical protein